MVCRLPHVDCPQGIINPRLPSDFSPYFLHLSFLCVCAIQQGSTYKGTPEITSSHPKQLQIQSTLKIEIIFIAWHLEIYELHFPF